MHIIFALVAAAALLCLWLTGHWFARVLAFLTFAVGFFFFAMALHHGPVEPGDGVIPLIIATAIAWVVSGIPVYIRRGATKRAN